MPKRCQVVQSVVTVTTAGGPLVGPSKNRVGLVISSPAANRITVSQNPSPVLDAGIDIYASTLPLQLYYEDWGSALQDQWFAIAATANATIGVTELLAEP